MQLTQQIRIQPSKAQEQVLKDLSEKCRLIYNFALDERKKTFEQEKRSVSYIEQQNKLPKTKEEYPEYKWVYSKVLQYTLRTLDADFKSFFALWKKGDKDARPPKFKGKQFFTTMVYNQSGFKFGKGWVQFSHKHPSKTKLKFDIPDKFSFDKVYQVSLYKKDGDYYISVTYEEQEQKYIDNDMYQAFDLGVMKHTAINSKGRAIEFTNERPDKYWDDKIRTVQSKRDHCKKNSKRYKRYDNALKTMKRKSANQMKDFQHKLSRKVIDNTKANTIIVGDLSVKDMCKINKYQKGLHTSLHNTGHIARFVRFLTYKAKLVGKRVVETNERKTSKRCCVCGSEQDIPLYKRTYDCGTCGSTMDRDENSAINIMLRYLSQNGLWTVYQHFVDNLRQTGIAIQNQALHSQEAPSLGAV